MCSPTSSLVLLSTCIKRIVGRMELKQLNIPYFGLYSHRNIESFLKIWKKSTSLVAKDCRLLHTIFAFQLIIALWIMDLSGNKSGTVAKALAFHQCGPGWIPGFYAIRWVEFVGSLLCPRGFSPGTPVFPSPQKPTFAGVAQLASALLSEL